MYKCTHCNEIISKDQFDGRIVKAGPKLYCVKCGEPVVEIPDSPTIGAGFHGAQATLISNSDNRITTNYYYGGSIDDLVDTAYGQYKRSETRLCKHCKQRVPLEFFNLERGVCDECISKEASNSLKEGKLYLETGLYNEALFCFLRYEKTCTDVDQLSDARSLIGRCYYEQENYKNALKYFALSSELSVDSQYYIGTIYEKGYGVDQNYQEAVKWYRKAAELGNGDAQYRLGIMYYDGRGVAKDCIRGIKHIGQARQHGNDNAIVFLDNLSLTRWTSKDTSQVLWGFVNNEGGFVISPNWKDVGELFFEGLTYVKDSNDKWGFIDKTGKIIIPCQWKHVWYFSGGFAAVTDSNDKWGFIDKTGKIIIPCQWEGVKGFSGGLCPVENSQGKWGCVDKTGKIVIPCQWNCLDLDKWGLIRVEDTNGKWGWIDNTGKTVVSCRWARAWMFTGDTTGVKDSNGKWWTINKRGEIVNTEKK